VSFSSKWRLIGIFKGAIGKTCFTKFVCYISFHSSDQEDIPVVKKPEPEPVIEEKEAKTTEEKDATVVEGGDNQEEVRGGHDIFVKHEIL
jgi:hypothetical protein